MIHIAGMGVLGSFLAWELHTRSIPFTWNDTESPVNAWSACTGAIFPTGKDEDMLNYFRWFDRWQYSSCPWHKQFMVSFLERADYLFLTERPPHGGKYTVNKKVFNFNRGQLPSLHFNAQAFVVKTRGFFEKQRQLTVNPEQLIVAHGFSHRLRDYVWGWTVPVKLTYPREFAWDGHRPCFYMRKGSFFLYAYPIPCTDRWYAGSSLIACQQACAYEIEPKFLTWLRWFRKFTEGRVQVEPVDPVVHSMVGWRPRGWEKDTEEVVHGNDSPFPLYIRPHWHDGVRNGPGIINAVLEKVGIVP